MASRVEITCPHDAPALPMRAFLPGYLAKRRHDCGDAVEHLDDGTIKYTLPIKFPSVLVAMLSISAMDFTETIRRDPAGTVYISATCEAADVTVRTAVTEKGNGIHVTTTVDALPVFRGITIPNYLVTKFIDRKFKEERGRDAEFAQAFV